MSDERRRRTPPPKFRPPPLPRRAPRGAQEPYQIQRRPSYDYGDHDLYDDYDDQDNYDYNTRRRPPRRQPSRQPIRRGRRQPQRLKKGPVVVLLLIIFLPVMAIALWGRGGNEEYIPVVILPQDEEREEPEVVGIRMHTRPLATLVDTGYLKLVNRDFAMSRDMDYSTLFSVAPLLPARANYITVHRSLLGAMQSLFAQADGIGPFFVTSGYRDVARQAEIYENSLDRRFVMPAGHSEHNLGLAADILIDGVSMDDMSEHPAAAWLAQNAWQHGLILRYPYGSYEITRVPHEPWHFRYVGLPHAFYMATANIVLEEYLQLLASRHDSLVVPIDGITYHIWYRRPTADGELFVPQDLPFSISTSNRGGYVVTAWE